MLAEFLALLGIDERERRSFFRGAIVEMFVAIIKIPTGFGVGRIDVENGLEIDRSALKTLSMHHQHCAPHQRGNVCGDTLEDFVVDAESFVTLSFLDQF